MNIKPKNGKALFRKQHLRFAHLKLELQDALRMNCCMEKRHLYQGSHSMRKEITVWNKQT